MSALDGSGGQKKLFTEVTWGNLMDDLQAAIEEVGVLWVERRGATEQTASTSRDLPGRSSSDPRNAGGRQVDQWERPKSAFS